MYITRKQDKKETKTRVVQDLETGDTFVRASDQDHLLSVVDPNHGDDEYDEDGLEVYMVVERYPDKKKRGSDDYKFAICINNGEWAKFEEGIKVIQVQAYTRLELA